MKKHRYYAQASWYIFFNEEEASFSFDGFFKAVDPIDVMSQIENMLGIDIVEKFTTVMIKKEED